MDEKIYTYNKFKLILPIHHVPHVNFDTYVQLIKASKYELKSDNFLKLLNFNEINKRDLISLIMIANYPDVVANSANIDNKPIIDQCKLFFDNLVEVDEETNMDQLFLKLRNQLKDLTKVYFDWKKEDLDKNLEYFIHSYYELEQMRLNLSVYKEDTEIIPNLKKIKEEQDKLKVYIKKIAGDDGLKLLNDKSPVYINIEQFKQVATKAFWDTFKEKLDQEEPDYTRLIIMIKEIKQLFYSVIPNNLKVQHEIHESIDIDLLQQKLDHKAMKFEDIFIIMEYIVSLIQRFQSPSQDKPTEEWWNNIKEMMNPDTSYGKLITEFFIGVFERIEKIQEEISIFKNNYES